MLNNVEDMTAALLWSNSHDNIVMTRTCSQLLLAWVACASAGANAPPIIIDVPLNRVRGPFNLSQAGIERRRQRRSRTTGVCLLICRSEMPKMAHLDG